ncbi:hypothetical protein [Lactobacillus hominis]|uniref:Uncharacterized protein n=1 Tax=Lactobacillus hominis DSM 23910 = CRBIP 24.179 TaxID=1423758 RepID=I7IVL3_9LACO|nr:hypothetical protein [Lactobacillus hominis]KRM85816.1 hypothetical protein FC41_GL000001 [Lactobacillus hominis DSM 23910 = CRBIP 24.179]MCT3348953.1 hypothetical protein [Lactobacillus hominis]CCI81643.1 Protein of unknown function [Lactobacillus hominis DSM 23910 = CRBIP 24.179]
MIIDNQKALEKLASNMGTSIATLQLKVAKLETALAGYQAENSELKLKLKMKEGAENESTQTRARHEQKSN